jgi:hypothetical protein
MEVIYAVKEHFIPFHYCVTWHSACKICRMHYAQLYCERSCRRGMMHHSKIVSPVYTTAQLSLQIYFTISAVYLKKSVEVSSNLQHTYFF